MSHVYHAIENVVYDESGTVMVVVSTVMFLFHVACEMAEIIAEEMTDREMLDSDVVRAYVH